MLVSRRCVLLAALVAVAFLASAVTGALHLALESHGDHHSGHHDDDDHDEDADHDARDHQVEARPASPVATMPELAPVVPIELLEPPRPAAAAIARYEPPPDDDVALSPRSPRAPPLA